MPSLFPSNKLVIASHNSGKLREFEKLLPLPGVSLVSAGALGLPEPDETGLTFAENALLKADAAMNASGLVALADDSGLAVEALDGAPGIYSARLAGVEKDFGRAMQTIAQQLEQKGLVPTGQKAAFIAVLVLAFPQRPPLQVEGRVEGRLVFPPRGTGGFGYDPIFIPEGETRSFGEMAAQEKARFSHRALACRALLRALEGI
jgi:XTP/dITP diphosphohydrolase